MKKFFDNVLEWVKQHRMATIGIAAGCVVLIAVAVATLVGMTEAVTTDGRVSANGITREQWIKLYGSKFNITNYEQAEPYYSDVKSDSEVFGYVQAFVENQIMSGEGKAELDEKITFEEALIQLARYYGDNYIKGATGKNELTDADRLEFLKKDAEISIENMNIALDEEKANELLDLVWNSYLNREFRNTNKINYAENVIDLSTVKDYEYADDKLVVKTDKDITEGKVLVLGENDEYIAGLALKVTKASQENGIYTLDVVTPEINEIADDFYLEVSQVIDFEGFEPAEGVTIEEIGTETAESNEPARADFMVNRTPRVKNGGGNIIKSEDGEVLLALAKFDAGRSGKFLKLKLNLTEGTVSTSAVWKNLESELELTKPELYQYGVDENGKLISKFDDSGFKVKGSLTLKDLVLNGQVDYKKGVKFDFNAGITAQPSLSVEGNAKGKQIRIGKQHIPLAFGISARIDIYLCVDFKGEVSVKPEFTGMVNINKKAGKTVNATGKCKSDFKSAINCEAKVKVEPDFVINFFGIDVMDAYVNLGLGADVTYSVKNPQKIVVDVYAPTLEAGVGNKDNTVLRKLGVKKIEIKLVDKKDAPFKCPFTAQYTYDILTQKVDYSQEIQSPEEESSDGTGETAANENGNTGTTDGNNQSGGSSGDNSEGGSSSESSDNETQKPAESTHYRLSEKSYDWDWAVGFGTNAYLVKKDGMYGAVDFEGNVKIPFIYEEVKDVGNDECEFLKNGVGYVYDDKCKLLFSYNKTELISNPDDYKFTKGDATMTLNYCRIEKEYNKGMMLEIIPYVGDGGWFWLDKFVFKKGNTDTIIASGYGHSYGITTYNCWNGILFASEDGDNTAIAVEEDLVTGKTYINIIDKDKAKKVEVQEVSGGSHAYGGVWLKDFFLSNLINVNTGQIINMPYGGYGAITDYYAGRGEYYAVSIDNGNTYDICKGSKIMSKGWKWVNFSDDKYIIAGNSTGEFVFMDYNGNKKASYKDSSEFFDGKALVSDGTGIFYIDENLNKISDYIYKGTVDDAGCIGRAVKINNKYYLISQ